MEEVVNLNRIPLSNVSALQGIQQTGLSQNIKGLKGEFLELLTQMTEQATDEVNLLQSCKSGIPDSAHEGKNLPRFFTEFLPSRMDLKSRITKEEKSSEDNPNRSMISDPIYATPINLIQETQFAIIDPKEMKPCRSTIEPDLKAIVKPEKVDISIGSTVNERKERNSVQAVEEVVSEKQSVNMEKLIQETRMPPADRPQELQGIAATGDSFSSDPKIADIAKTEPYHQISREILSKIEQKGPAEFKLQLEPENLGLIDIKLKLKEGKLIIDIMASSSKTQALLTSQVDKLVMSMGLQNVQVEQVQVNQPYNTQNMFGQNQAFFMNSGMSFSQRRQQEQFINQPFPWSNQSVTVENAEIEGIEGAKFVRGSSYRLNYSI